MADLRELIRTRSSLSYARRLLRPRRDLATITLVGSTALAGAIAVIALWNAGIFRVHGKLLELEDLDHIGSFLSGVLTPVALAWTARSFVLQRRAFDAAVNAERRERLAALAASEPIFSIERVFKLVMDDEIKLEIHRAGGEVRRVRAAFCLQMTRAPSSYDESSLGIAQPEVTERLLNHTFPQVVSLRFTNLRFMPGEKHDCWIVLRVERQDRYVSTYAFHAKWKANPVLIGSRPCDPRQDMDEPFPPAERWPSWLQERRWEDRHPW